MLNVGASVFCYTIQQTEKEMVDYYTYCNFLPVHVIRANPLDSDSSNSETN